MKNVMIEKEAMISKAQFLAMLQECGLDFSDDFVGQGIYEVQWGCRGEIDEVLFNNTYLEREELIDPEEFAEMDCEEKEYVLDELEEFYEVEGMTTDMDLPCFVVNYYEESASAFFLVSGE